MEGLLSPENELHWLAASSQTTKTILHRSTSTLPRRIGASSGLDPALSIRGCKANCRSFATERVTKEGKEARKEQKGDKDYGGPTSSTSSSFSSAATATSWSAAGWSLDSCATLPNAISAARALSAPFLFRAITRGEWEAAGILLAFGAASDWADGASARFLDARRRRKRKSETGDGGSSAPSASSSPSSSSSSSSPLGTYLDPLADKVFIGAAVAAAAGWGGGGDGGFSAAAAAAFEGAGGAGGGEDGEGQGGQSGSGRPSPPSSSSHRWPLLPSWLAAAVIGRDVFLVAGSLLARLRQFEGGRWPGGPEFFRLVDDVDVVDGGKEDDKNGGGGG